MSTCQRYLEVLPCRIVADPGLVLDDVIRRMIAGRSRRRCGSDGGVGVNVVILQAFWQNSRGRHVTCMIGISVDGGWRTGAESTGEDTGDTAVATTGMARTMGCMADACPELASTVGK